LQVKRKYFTREEFWETVGNKQANGHEYRYKTSGAIYSGEWMGGLRNGHGKMQWIDGAYFEGSWVLGRAEGEGRFVHATGDAY
jgi:hypothetical protein